MKRLLVHRCLLGLFLLLPWTHGVGQAASATRPDLTREPTLYVVAYTHLDTQWRWDYVKTISEYIPNTLRENFAMFEKYPHYLLNFSGANRYQMMKDYYPADYEQLKHYIAAGRWFPCGSSWEEGDVNLVSAEALTRQILHGNRFFQREFGQTSAEFMLPDCFGFPATLPSILAHAGIKGFSTQKLKSFLGGAPVGGPGSPEDTPEGIPFNVGLWQGPDGKGVVAALNAEKYTGVVCQDLSQSPPPMNYSPDANQRMKDAVRDWPKRIELNGKVSGLYTDYHYYGAGDVGGAPLEASIRVMEAIVTKGRTPLPPLDWITARYPTKPEPVVTTPPVKLGDGPVNVIPATAEQMFLDITPEQTKGLPRYTGNLLLIKHSTAVLTSQAYMKAWNRQNELLADAAERAALGAEWLGARPYPRERFLQAWQLVLAGHFHDILPGPSIPEAYEYSWNDQLIALNQFGGILTDASGVIASRMDTRAQGTAVVVYNPLNRAREDVVEATITFPRGTPNAIRVIGPDGQPTPAQLTADGRVLFIAHVPSVGYAAYDVQPAAASLASTLKITERTLENDRYRVALDAHGDIASIHDKATSRELLSAPHRLAFQSQMPRNTPAWDFDWEDQKMPPRGFVEGPAQVRILENGPVRIALEITRDSEDSRFVQIVRLCAGSAGERVELANVIDWKTKGAALKATFPLRASNPEATYSWGIGTIKRGNNHERQYEVPAQQWFDLTDRSGAHGVTILTDAKYGSDKPSDNTVRLTLLYSPAINPKTAARFLPDQATQDWGRHEFTYGLASHGGDYRQAQTDWQALRLNQPLLSFVSPSHPGSLGKQFSLLRVSHPRVRILALKKAEDSDELVVRLVAMDGQANAGIRLSFAAPVTAAREITSQEKPLGAARIVDGQLALDLTPFELRSFAVKLAAATERVPAPVSQPVELPYDLAVASQDGTPTAGGFDAEGRSLAAEMVPITLPYAGITFHLGPAGTGKPNAVVARGQTIALPAGKCNRLYLLAASAEGDHTATFRIGASSTERTIQCWGGFIGQWDNRRWSAPREQGPPGYDFPDAPPPKFPAYLGLTPGFVKPAQVAWFASHRHTAKGENLPYSYSYLYAYPLDVPPGATFLTLPDNDKIRILAATVVDEGPRVRPARALYDTLARPGPLAAR